MKHKKLMVYLFVAAALFYMFTRPADAATAVRGIYDGVSAGCGQLIQFVSRLFS
ncbi:hypothetical protein [Sphaerisporangium sp. TRM90804]|uniref:hypothetical protein n=1 Tax=Sphaerisporangium sp. TRM90804 TaxID=3031113 RepID=UPI0024471AF9|nr:hypothetical protein [Sphaerisporangium sp. TRM90804]MDH2428570.1 hypothetical protein [Sphaerisporangium sp. TRM90804]